MNTKLYISILCLLSSYSIFSTFHIIDMKSGIKDSQKMRASIQSQIQSQPKDQQESIKLLIKSIETKERNLQTAALGLKFLKYGSCLSKNIIRGQTDRYNTIYLEYFQLDQALRAIPIPQPQ